MASPESFSPPDPTAQAVAIDARTHPTSTDAPSLFASYMELGKARLSAMVVVTTALGYIVASRAFPSPDGFDFQRLLFTCLGTFLSAVGAGAFNQVIEAPRDARMNRTKSRPIPAGHLSRTHAAFFALIVSILGVAILCPTSNGLTACLALLNILLYVLVYTPMKPLSSTNTLVGAIVGGIPPMMGWSAATGGGGSLSAGAWVLGAILFVWQIPHFLALAWMYRLDYAKGGFKMLSITDPTGVLTGLCSILYTLLLLPLNLELVRLHHAGLPFAILSTALTLWMLYLAIKFAKTRAHADARKLFFASIIYLPLLTLTLSLDARGPADTMLPTPNAYILPAN